MPTSKPRFTITCEERTHQVISRLAELQGRTRGAVVAELLDEVVPVLERTITLLEAATEAPDRVREGMIRSIERAHGEMVESAGDSMHQIDMLMQQFLEAGEQGRPPHSNTGVRSTTGKEQKRPPKARKGSRKGVSGNGQV